MEGGDHILIERPLVGTNADTAPCSASAPALGNLNSRHRAVHGRTPRHATPRHVRT
eukprot:COSAG01_NODE_6347_length_3721_cov_9.462452_1_plen_56_part_00